MRDSVVSMSARGGVPELRSRVMIRLNRSSMDDDPAARSRSSGMAMVSSAETPGISTSANPTELREPTGTVGRTRPTPATVIRSVVKVRAGKVTTCPGGVREAAPSGDGDRVAAVEGQGGLGDGCGRGSPVWGWSRVTELSVRG